MVNDALANTLGEIVECIASTPHHPERVRFGDITAALATGDAIPQVGASTARIIGVPGYIRDASDSKPCKPRPLDVVQSFNDFSGSIYGGGSFYFYCINGGRIEHTRPAVIMEVCVYTRPSTFTGAISLEDWHEGGLVSGSVAKLALKESMFAALYGAANSDWLAHLAEIKSYGNPDLYGRATAAPVST